jgi:demethylmenaquinone methyltransferase/2-methoxy-6-polyprenyl-1,4-benzoquinol methylase
MRALPEVARRVSSNPDAYVYLAESIRAWPDQARLAGELAAAGWRRVAWRNLSGGIVALHKAARAEDGPDIPVEAGRVGSGSAS